jgi:hypothetical protein
MFLSCFATASAGDFQAHSAPIGGGFRCGAETSLSIAALNMVIPWRLSTTTTLFHDSTASCQRVNVSLLDTLVVAAVDRDGGALTLGYLGTEQLR